MSETIDAMRRQSIPSKPSTDEQLIEFEQALIAQAIVPNIMNPCMKRTMNVGPKKFVGKKPNPQIHQHSNKRTNFTEFDTLSMVQSQKTGLTSKPNKGLRSTFSGTSRTRQLRDDNEAAMASNADDLMKRVDTSSKCGGNLLSEQMETNSFTSAGFISQGQLNVKDSR